MRCMEPGVALEPTVPVGETRDLKTQEESMKRALAESPGTVSARRHGFARRGWSR